MSLARAARHRLTHNLGWKLASLGLASLLWLAYVGDPELVTMASVPVLYRGLAPEFVLVSGAPDDLRVELMGPSAKLTRAALSEAAALLDLSGVQRPGEQTFTLSRESMSLPSGVMFLRAVPAQLRIEFDRFETKDVPVRLRTAGEPAAGYRVASSQILPAQIRIRGPQARLDQTFAAETDAVDITGFYKDSEIRVNTFVTDPRVQLESPPSVTVKLRVARADGSGPP